MVKISVFPLDNMFLVQTWYFAANRELHVVRAEYTRFDYIGSCDF